MNEYVVDTSILVQALITDQHTLYVKALLKQSIDQNTLWAPEFCLLECTNVLWKEVRFNGLPLERAEELADYIPQLPVTLYPAKELLKRALQIGAKFELAVYDSVFLAACERLDCPLITVDQKQSKAATELGVTLKSIADFTGSPS